jgi:hypothetical protein
MKIGESDARVGEPVQVGRFDLPTEGSDIGKPKIVCHDHQEVGPLHAEASCQVRDRNGTFWVLVI